MNFEVVEYQCEIAEFIITVHHYSDIQWIWVVYTYGKGRLDTPDQRFDSAEEAIADATAYYHRELAK